MTIQQYIGRTIDVLAYRGAKSSGEQLLEMSLANETSSGQITTGIQKLAQRFILELFTETGSIKYLPDRGCDFLIEAQQGYWQHPLDIMTSFSAAIVDVKTNLQLEESEDDPADERFSSVELLGVEIIGDTASIRVRVTSLAGTSREVILPLDTAL